MELALLMSVAPAAVRRVHRLEFALRCVRAGLRPFEVANSLQRNFDVSRSTAWRIADMALDLEGR